MMLAVSCEKHCEKLQAIIRKFLGRIKFVNVSSQPLSGVIMPERDHVFSAGVGDGKQLAAPWLDISDLSSEEAIQAFCAFIEAIIKQEGQIRGLGDVVAKATKLVGIVPCAGCAKRQAALNRMFPSKSYKNTLASAANADKVGEKVRP